MRIFLCWSGERSRHVATALEAFLRDLNSNLFKGSPPLFETFRSDNIEKGLLWFRAVEKELADADAALLSITPENADSPWIHYEAGAIANRFLAKHSESSARVDALKARLFTYLFGMDARDLRGPLAAYQSTTATFEDTRVLVQQLLTLADSRRTDDSSGNPACVHWTEDTKDAFRLCWNRFSSSLQLCRTQPFGDVVAGFEQKFRRLTFEEPIALCHRQAWIDRIKGCHEVLGELQRHLDEVKARCRAYEAELYQQLLTALDGYEMTMHAYLASERRFELGENGKLSMPKDIEWVCEHRRHVVLDAVAVLLDPKLAPVFDESPAFARLETFAEKKNTIHRKAAAIRRWLSQQEQNRSGESKAQYSPRGNGAVTAFDGVNLTQWNVSPVFPGADEFESASESDWDFDRVVYYITHIESLRQNLTEEVAKQHKILTGINLEKKIARCLQEEIEKIRAKRRTEQATENLGQASAEAIARKSSEGKRQDEDAETPSRIPLYYALGILDELIRKGSKSTDDATHRLDRAMAQEFADIVKSTIELERGLVSQVATRAESLLKKLEPLQSDFGRVEELSPGSRS